MTDQINTGGAAFPIVVPDMDNAPTGEMLLLACANWPLIKCGREVPVKVGYKSFGTWVVFGASWTPTHWMPLPATPTTEAGK